MTMLLLIEFVMFYTFMYLGTQCPDCEIRNADFAEIDLTGITVRLRLFRACGVARGHSGVIISQSGKLVQSQTNKFCQHKSFQDDVLGEFDGEFEVFNGGSVAAFKHRSCPFGVRFRMGKKKARRNAEGLNDDEDDISRAWNNLVQLRLVVIKSQQAIHKLTAQLHQATLELKDVLAERDGLQAGIQRLRESKQVCSCRRQRPVVQEPTGRPWHPTHRGKRGGRKHDSFTTARPASTQDRRVLKVPAVQTK